MTLVSDLLPTADQSMGSSTVRASLSQEGSLRASPPSQGSPASVRGRGEPGQAESGEDASEPRRRRGERRPSSVQSTDADVESDESDPFSLI